MSSRNRVALVSEIFRQFGFHLERGLVGRHGLGREPLRLHDARMVGLRVGVVEVTEVVERVVDGLVAVRRRRAVDCGRSNAAVSRW